MRTTTIRVDAATHAQLVELSRARGKTLIDTVSDAAEALRREGFAGQVSAELARLRTDPGRWSSYLADAESSSVTDGIG